MRRAAPTGPGASCLICLSRQFHLYFLQAYVEFCGVNQDRIVLSRSEAAELAQTMAAALNFREIFEVALGDRHRIAIDARVERVPKSLLQKLFFLAIPSRYAIILVFSDTARRWSIVDRDMLRANLDKLVSYLSQSDQPQGAPRESERG